MTIRAKLYAAIVMTVLGPAVIIAVAVAGLGALDDRFAEVEERGAAQALALELKFAVTDLNGWQTAYGYDDGRSRPRFVRASREARRQLARARRELTDPREAALLRRLETGLREFMALDAVAYAALRQGRTERVRQIFLGPEIERFEDMAAAAGELSAYEARQAAAARRAADAERRDVRRQVVAVGLGAGVLVVVLLLTAWDVARLALEREPGGPPRPAGPEPPSGA